MESDIQALRAPPYIHHLDAGKLRLQYRRCILYLIWSADDVADLDGNLHMPTAWNRERRCNGTLLQARTSSEDGLVDFDDDSRDAYGTFPHGFCGPASQRELDLRDPRHHKLLSVLRVPIA